MISDRSQYLPIPYGQLSNQNPVRPVTLPYNPTTLSFSPLSPFDSLSSITETQIPFLRSLFFSSASAQSHNSRLILSPTAPSLLRRTSSQRRRHARTQSSPPELRGVEDEVADKLGFEKVSEDFFGDCNSNAVLFRHKKTGAQIMSLSNDDDRKVFGIVFRTPPIDSIGVANILRQSVLYGSRKYPVKKPFDELVKGSYSTSLHAKTMADRTYYSGSCTSTKELYNMVDVHLDAVFFPKCLEDVQIFQQQGWLTSSMTLPTIYLNNVGDLIHVPSSRILGVVFNQRKEFYSRPLPEDILRLTAQQWYRSDLFVVEFVEIMCSVDIPAIRFADLAIFPDSTYGVDCAGDPKIIPQLTFEDFKEFHWKCYHPSNARIWFYGDDDPTERLHIMSGYLDMFDASSTPNESKVQPQRQFSEPVRIVKNYPYNQPATILSPLKTILLEFGFTDVIIEVDFHPLQPIFTIAFVGVSHDDILKAQLIVMTTLMVFAEKGFSTDSVEASMNTTEFILRECNAESFPRGLSLMLQCIDKWIHDMDPFEPLHYGKTLKTLNSMIQKEGSKAVFTPLIEKFTVNNPHRIVITTQPDPQKASRDEKFEKEILRKVKAGMTEEDLAELALATQELQLKQKTPDPPEALRSVSSLSLLDIPKEPIHVPTEVVYINGVKVLQHEVFTNDVFYIDIVFPLSSLKQELLPLVPMFCLLLLNTITKDMNFIQLHELVKRKTGGISIDPMTSSVRCKKDPCGHLVVRGKVMAGRAEDLFELIHYILQEVRFTEPEPLKHKVSQFIAEYQDNASRHENAAARMDAKLNVSGWLREQIFGVSQVEFLQALEKKVDQDWDGISSSLEEICKSVICKKGCFIIMTAEGKNPTQSQKFVSKFLDLLPSKSPFARRTTWKATLPSENEAIIIPTKVNHVGKSVILHDSGYRINGSTLISKFINDTWLHDLVGISGEASASCYFDINTGVFSFLYVRDPNLLKTLDVYDGTEDFLRKLEMDDDTLRKAIVLALRDDSYQLLDDKGYSGSLKGDLMGVTEEERQRRHKGILSTSLKDFKKFADAFDAVKGKGVVVTVGAPLGVKAALKKRPKLFKLKIVPLFSELDIVS